MIAEESSRRKGIAYEALTLFMAYCVKHLVSNPGIAHCSHSNSDCEELAAPTVPVSSVTTLFCYHAAVTTALRGNKKEALSFGCTSVAPPLLGLYVRRQHVRVT